MTSVRTISILATTTLSLLAAPAFAAGNDEHDAHHPAAAAEQRLAQAPQAAQGMGMGSTTAAPSGAAAAPAGYAEQMKAMQSMHDKMLAAKTPEERNALMAEQMKLMEDGMAMMGRMGGMGMGGAAMMGGNRPGAAPVQPGEMAARQGMMEQRMDMMQSMMQMMMDRMAPAPARK